METYFKNRKAGYTSHVSMNVVENNGAIIALLFLKMFATGRRVHQGSNSWAGFQLIFMKGERTLRAKEACSGGIYLSRYGGGDTFLIIEERMTERFRQVNGLYRPETWVSISTTARPATKEEVYKFRGYYPQSWSFVGEPESVCSFWVDIDSLAQEGLENYPRFGALNVAFDPFQEYCTPDGKISCQGLEIDPIRIEFRFGCQNGKIPTMGQIGMAQKAYPKTPENREVRNLFAAYVKVAIEFVPDRQEEMEENFSSISNPPRKRRRISSPPKMGIKK